MSGDVYPKLRVAAVHAAPVFLDRDASLDKVEHLVAEAAGHGAEVVAFGEAFLPGFPIWNNVLPPVDHHPFFERLFANAVTVPGVECSRLGALSRRYGVTLSIGVNEKSSNSMGTLWNTNLIFDPSGNLVNHRRKLVPTWTERMTWSHGDGAGLEPVTINDCKIGVLICGENTNPLAKFTLMAQGEQLHIATYPPPWPFHRSQKNDYDLAKAIEIRSAAHSFEGKVFTLVAATALDDDAVTQVAGDDTRVSEMLLGASHPVSLVLGPSGEVVAGPISDEGILVADIDVQDSILPKVIHDVVGTYNRFDVFNLTVNKRRLEPVHFDMRAESPYAGRSEESHMDDARQRNDYASVNIESELTGNSPAQPSQ